MQLFQRGRSRIGAASGPALYYGIDQIGSVSRVFENATSAPAYDDDPWGNALQTTAPLADYGFAGMFNHAPSRLGLTWFRAYDPNVGRWVSRDPLGEMTDPAGNLYAYVGNRPIYANDYTGLLADQSSKGPHDSSCSLGSNHNGPVPENKPTETADLSDDLESLGGGIPRSVPTPRGATQFIFPNGMIHRFDISPGQYNSKYGPHINLEGPWGNEHVPLSR